MSDPDLAKLVALAEGDGLSFHQPAATVLDANYPATPLSSMLDVRMLFSCLVDADFLDTEAHFQADAKGKRYRPQGPRLETEDALAALDRFMEKTIRRKGNPSADVAKVRELLWKMAATAAVAPVGLFTMTAPTGSGKTLSMLKFALEHARCNQMQRVVLAVPFLTIIEQTAMVYRSVFRDFSECFILEQHSLAGLGQAVEEGDDVSEQERARRLLAENWDAPIIITTNVQLLESLFANRPSACRKLHNLMNAVIMFDEAQTLPQHLTVPTLAALSHLSARYGSSVLFATATQPAFDFLNRPVRKMFAVPSGWRPVETAPEYPRLYQNLRRCQVVWPAAGETKPWPELAAEISEEAQVLCVVNLKKHALALLDELVDEESVLHLSTNLCALHRRSVLDAVRERLRQGLSCRLISTQCVEAGVDVDFPVVYRAMAPLEAIVQAAGRCNREGKLQDASGRPQPGKIRVFEPDVGEEYHSRYPTRDYQRAAEVTRSMLIEAGKEGLDLDDPGIFRTYYRTLYDLARPETRNRELLDAITRMDFAAVARLYRIIEHDAVQILVPYKPCKDLFEGLRQEEENDGIDVTWIRRAQRLAVSVYRPKRKHPVWEVLAPAKLRHGGRDAVSEEWFILQDEGCYDETLGLRLPQERQLLIA